MRWATIISSGRRVPIIVEGNEFFVFHKTTCLGASVSGPFLLTDPRFQIEVA